MSDYPFHLVQGTVDGPVGEDQRAFLSQRPFTRMDDSFQGMAARYRPSLALEDAINTAIAVGDPLLLTGEPGTGKTQAAYWVAYKLALDLFHFQTKSVSTAGDLLYHFDTVRYFFDAHGGSKVDAVESLDKRNYVEERAFWKALASATTSGYPAVLLIDEIDKAPRDFPNDLLHELDKMSFHVVETGETIVAEAKHRPIVFITSNSERRLPEPFLRRCVYHHIRFDDKDLREAVAAHADTYPGLSEDLWEKAIQVFGQIRGYSLRKKPAAGELLVWLQTLSAASITQAQALDVPLGELPFLGVLLKDHQDMAELQGF